MHVPRAVNVIESRRALLSGSRPCVGTIGESRPV